MKEEKIMLRKAKKLYEKYKRAKVTAEELKKASKLKIK